MLDVSTIGTVAVPKRSALKTSRRELSEDASFGIWHPLGCRAIELGKTPQGGVTHTVVHGAWYSDSRKLFFFNAIFFAKLSGRKKQIKKGKHKWTPLPLKVALSIRSYNE